MSDSINTENKKSGTDPENSADIDINELLRRYLPEEYVGIDNAGEAARDAAAPAENADVNKGMDRGMDREIESDTDDKEYGASDKKRLDSSRGRRRLQQKRRPVNIAAQESGQMSFSPNTTQNADDMTPDQASEAAVDDDINYDIDFVDVAVNNTVFTDIESESDVKSYVKAQIDAQADSGFAASEAELNASSDLYEPDADIFAEFDEGENLESYDYIDDEDDVSSAATTVINKAGNAGYNAYDGDAEATREHDIVSPTEADDGFDLTDDVSDADGETNDEQGGEQSDEAEFNYEDDPIDDFDMNILLGLGMEDKLEETIGIDKVSKFVEKQQSDLEKTEQLSRERAALDYEYTSKTQTREVIGAYQSAYLASKIKLIVAAVLTLILFIYECHSFLGIKFTGAFDPTVYPVLYIMVGFQLLLFIAAPAVKSIISGTREFFRGKPSPEGLAAFALFINIVYNVAISFAPVYGEGGPVIVNLPVAACFMMLYVYEFINIRREIFSFSIVSSKKRKFALQSLTMAQSQLELHSFSDMMEEDDNADDINVLKIENAGFVNDYFLRTNRYPGGRKFIGFIVPAVLVVAAAFFAYKYNADGTFYSGMNAAVLSALMCLPVSIFYMFSHPFYRAVAHAYEDESTIVGESSAEEYADAAIISFDDKNVFPSTGVNVRAVNVFGDNRIDRVLYYAASVFCTIGGPLSDVFDLATRDIGYSSDVKLVRCISGCLEMTVDGDTISIGGLEALGGVGVRIPSQLSERDTPQEDPTVSVMYMAQNGRIISRMLVQYLVDSDFEFILKQLDKSGMFIGIKTFDPNVTEEFINRQVKLKDYPVRVIRCQSLDDRTKVTENSVSGLISKGSPKALLQTVTLCEKVLHVRSINTMLIIISLFISLVLTALSILFGAFTISPLFIVLYQLIYIVPMWFVSKMIS